MMTYILYSKTIMIEASSKIYRYIVYIIIMLLIIVFFAHLSIMASPAIYMPELVLEIAILILILDSWWTKTPILVRILMIGTDIILIEEFIRFLALK